MDYYSAIKKNSFESVQMRWMKLEPIIPSEVSQKEKHQYMGVWPFSGLCLPPRAGETHSSLCHFPSWAAKGPGPQPPAPSLCSLCLFSFPPRHPPKNPHPAAPLMLHRCERGRRLGPSPFLPRVSCGPPPATGAIGEGSFQRVPAVLTP